jgi:hypothetical protein
LQEVTLGHRDLLVVEGVEVRKARKEKLSKERKENAREKKGVVDLLSHTTPATNTKRHHNRVKNREWACS